ncbi:MAG TPA: PIN-like domain-containing protein [Bacteroidota bacterium]|nr:PIN-like domain-containing protein [Bacteroidota bacterium]
MKNEFIGYYPPADSEINDAWGKGLISVDANVLLNLYRYTAKTRAEFLKVLQGLSARLWITHQAAHEYHERRIEVIRDQRDAYAKLGEELNKAETACKERINGFKLHPLIDTLRISETLHKAFEDASRQISKLEGTHPDLRASDSILPEVSALFDGKVGAKFLEEELSKLFAAGKERYANKFPPGYLDAKAKESRGDKAIYGDLIIWKQLIRKIREAPQPIILVTDDRKEDWWTKHRGEIVYPRPELIKEFFDETGIRILIYHADKFLEYAKQKLQPKIKSETIEEVRTIRKDDEKIGLIAYDALTSFQQPRFDFDALKIGSVLDSLAGIDKYISNPLMKNLTDLGFILPQWQDAASAYRKLFEFNPFQPQNSPLSSFIATPPQNNIHQASTAPMEESGTASQPPGKPPDPEEKIQQGDKEEVKRAENDKATDD